MRQRTDRNNLRRKLAIAFLATWLAPSALAQTYYKIANKLSGKVLDVTNLSTSDGALIQQWDWWGGDNQQWQLVPVDSTYYRIVSKLSGKVLDVQNVSTSNGALIQQWDWLGGANQQWQPVAVDSTYDRVVSKLSGKVLDVQGVSTSNGALIQQWDWLGGGNQQWQLVPYAPAPPAYVSLTPSSAAAAEQVFTMVWSSPNGWQDIGQADLLITANKSVPGPSCLMVYQVASNELSLATDSGSWVGGQLGSSGMLSNNNECSVNLANSWAQGSGNNLTVRLDLTSSGPFAGTTQQVYMGGAESNTGLGTDWQWMGTWTVPAAPPPDFQISVTPSATTLAGGTASYTVTVTGVNGFNGTVNLSAAGLPGGAGAVFGSPSITGSGSTTLSVGTVNTTSGGVTGNFSFSVTGTSGGLSHSGGAVLAIQDYALTITPQSQTVPTSGNALVTAQLKVVGINGYTGAVYIRYSVSPAAPSYPNLGLVQLYPLPTTLYPNSANDTASVTVNVYSTYPTMYDVHFWSEADGTHSTDLKITPSPSPTFSLGISPSVQAVTPPGSAQYTVTVSSTNGFNGSVAFSVSGLPGGVNSPTFSPASVAGSGSSVMTVTVPAGTAPGSYPITITGSSGATTSSVTVYLVIQSGPDFSITATPNSQTVAPTGIASYPILVNTAGGFTGSISFSASGTPPNASFGFGGVPTH